MQPSRYPVRLKHKYAAALRRIVSNDAPSKEFIKYVGLNQLEFRAFISSQLHPEFSALSYGRSWVLDHIVPLFLFDLDKEEELYTCYSYLNTIPMPLLLSRLRGISIDFALKEMDIRSGWVPGSPIIARLRSRIDGFVGVLDRYHSKAKPAFTGHGMIS